MNDPKFKIGQELYGCTLSGDGENVRRRLFVNQIIYDGIKERWIYIDTEDGLWKEDEVRDIKDIIFCAECGKEEFPNCGVDISTPFDADKIKVHWDCYYKNVKESWRLGRMK